MADQQPTTLPKAKEIRYWKVPIPLAGNGFFYGRTDSGKSWKMMAIAQGYHASGYKIWQVMGGKRKENNFWCFPSEEKKLWSDFEAEVGKMKNPGPKEYKVNLITFCFSNLLPNKLPEHLPRISHKIVTIPFRKIKIEDISLIIGEVTQNANYVWNTILKNTNKNSTGEDVKYLMHTKLKKYRELPIYKNFLEPAIDNHLLSSEVCPLNIDIEAEAKEKDIITILNQDYIPEEFKWFIPGYLLRNIMEMAMDERIHKKNIAICQEVSSFMKVQDKNVQGAEQTQIFRNQVSDVARYARSGLFMFMDCQSPSEVRSLISGQEDLMGINEMSSARDREELCEQLLKDRRISKLQVRYLYSIPIHQMVIVTRGQIAKLIKRVMPPRTQCWKPTLGNFANVWKNKYNSYKLIDEELKTIQREYENAKIEIDKKAALEEEEANLEDDTPIEEEVKIKKIDDNGELEEKEEYEGAEDNLEEEPEEQIVKEEEDKKQLSEEDKKIRAAERQRKRIEELERKANEDIFQYV